MPQTEAKSLGEYSVGDYYPFPYFVFTEKIFNLVNRRFDVVDLDPADYTQIRFCARHENNTEDIDDHAKDDIYADLVSDGSGVYHYVWTATDIDKIGRWNVRLEFVRVAGPKFHAPKEWFFMVRHKMAGSYGDH